MRHSMPCARMPSSFVTRNRISAPVLRRRVGREGAHERLEVRLQRLEGLKGQRSARGTPQLPPLPLLVHLLPSALDGVLLRVEEMLHEQDQLHLAPLVHAVARTILGRIEEAELALPVPQHVGLEIGQLAHLADAEELLHGLRGAHASCSARSSRAISSVTPRCAERPSKSTRYTMDTIGISTPSRSASASALFVVPTPSATVSFPASAASSVAPSPTAMPTARL